MKNDHENNDEPKPKSWVGKYLGAVAVAATGVAAGVAAFNEGKRATREGYIGEIPGQLTTPEGGIVKVVSDRNYPSVEDVKRMLLVSGTIDEDHINDMFAVGESIVPKSRVFDKVVLGPIAIYRPNGMPDHEEAETELTVRKNAAYFTLYQNLLKNARLIYFNCDKGKQFDRDLHTNPVAAALTLVDSIEAVLDKRKEKDGQIIDDISSEQVGLLYALKERLIELQQQQHFSLEDFASIKLPLSTGETINGVGVLIAFCRQIPINGNRDGTSMKFLKAAAINKEVTEPQLQVEIQGPLFIDLVLGKLEPPRLDANKSLVGLRGR